MKLPEQLPTDPEEIEMLYNAYAQEVDDIDDAELQRLLDARLAAWGIDPKRMTADQIFGAMAESMNSMLLNLQAAMAEAPDDLAAEQVSEIIQAAEKLRSQIDSAIHGASEDAAP